MAQCEKGGAGSSQRCQPDCTTRPLGLGQHMLPLPALQLACQIVSVTSEGVRCRSTRRLRLLRRWCHPPFANSQHKVKRTGPLRMERVKCAVAPRCMYVPHGRNGTILWTAYNTNENFTLLSTSQQAIHNRSPATLKRLSGNEQTERKMAARNQRPARTL